MDDKVSGDVNPSLRLLGLTSGLGCSVAVILLGLIGGGIFLDRRLDSEPLWTMVGLAVGITAVAIELVTIVRISRTRAASQPWPRSSRPPDPDEEED